MFTTRFAPSPTGYLHLGHAFSAWTAYEAAQSQRGTFILRIEDTDQTRCKPEYEAALLEDLAWLGLTWPEPVRRQSAHLADYQAALDQLIEKQLVYRCFKTRKDIAAESANAPHGLQTIYISSPLPPAEEGEHLSRGDAFAWRLSLTECRSYLGDRWDRLQFESDGELIKAQPELLGDVVIARKEFPTSYHLASVHDDARQGVTHIIRGEDLKEAAHLHVLLQALLDYPQPIYHHHRLLLDEDGKRFAKRNQSVTLRALRESGTSARQLREQLGFITNEG